MIDRLAGSPIYPRRNRGYCHAVVMEAFVQCFIDLEDIIGIHVATVLNAGTIAVLAGAELIDLGPQSALYQRCDLYRELCARPAYHCVIPSRWRRASRAGAGCQHPLDGMQRGRHGSRLRALESLHRRYTNRYAWMVRESPGPAGWAWTRSRPGLGCAFAKAVENSCFPGAVRKGYSVRWPQDA